MIMSDTLLFGYIANRSPTGHATATLVSRDSVGAPWTYLPDEGGPRRTARGPEPLYSTKEDAVLAARFRWRCNGGRPRARRPTPIDTIF
jgi:hypothetical protein